MFLFTTTALPTSEPPPVKGGVPHAVAMGAAARASGVSFGYLVETARRESGFRPQAQAASSSARGLYQFIDQTWLRTFRKEAASIGYAGDAQAIVIDQGGRASVADAGQRARILALRDNPAISAHMAAALARDNAAALESTLGRAPTDGEIYIAHFLGASAASRLIALKQGTPGASAADAFPAASQANRAIFFNQQGRARSAGDVYDRLVRGFGDGDATMQATSQPADDPRPFVSLFRNTGPVSALHQAAALWREAGLSGRPGQPLNLNAFRVRSTQA